MWVLSKRRFSIVWGRDRDPRSPLTMFPERIIVHFRGFPNHFSVPQYFFFSFFYKLFIFCLPLCSFLFEHITHLGRHNNLILLSDNYRMREEKKKRKHTRLHTHNHCHSMSVRSNPSKVGLKRNVG